MTLAILLSCRQVDPAPAEQTPSPESDTGTPPVADTTSTGIVTGDTGDPVVSPTPWGTVELGVPGWVVNVADLAVATDGGLCIVGSAWPDGFEYSSDVAVLKLDRTGALDAGFGKRGGVLLLEGTQLSLATDVAAADDGGCLVAGWDYGYDQRQPFVAVHAADGDLDSFGRVALDLEGGPEETIDVAATAEEGALVLRGGASGASVVRLLADGTMDPAWGVDGAAALPVALDCVYTSLCEHGTVAALADGGAVAVVGHPAAVVRLDAAGAVDPAYGVGGVVVSSGAFRAVAAHVEPDGRVWLGGSLSDDGYTAQVEAFDGSGMGAAPVTVEIGGRGLDLEDLAVDAAGRLVLAGRSTELDWAGRPAIVRALADGTLDASFGAGGIFEVDPVTGSAADFAALELAPDGTITAAGNHWGIDRIVAAALDGS